MDNGSEFISKALRAWAGEHEVMEAFILPGQPWHNGFVESFHNRICDELLEDNSFNNATQVEQMIAWWSKRYNEEHPHSALGYISSNAYAKK